MSVCIEQPDAPQRTAGTPVTILLSVYNGAAWLEHQLHSFLDQTDVDWRLAWRDDGSEDDSCAVMDAFARRAGGRCRRSASSGPHLGAAASFLQLLAENADAPFLAFADQDDFWLPRKLQHSLRMLGSSPAPALYCARQIVTDHSLGNPVRSTEYAGNPGFPACLAQNIATGNTVVMNRAAAALISAMPRPEASPHDWWSYIVVSACGGRVIYDPEPLTLYRQHGGNMVGAPPHVMGRALGALRRGPRIYMTMMRRHTERLWEHRDRLPPDAVETLRVIRSGLQGSLAERIAALRCPGFTRAAMLETLLFRLWFLAY